MLLPRPEKLDPADLITAREAAAILKVDPRTVGNYRKLELIDYIMFNPRRILYGRKSVLEYIGRCRKKTIEDQPNLFFPQ